MSQNESHPKTPQRDSENVESNTTPIELISGEDATVSETTQYITGWRLHAITVGLVVALFIAMIEALIASTAVLAITNDLGGYEKSSWIFTAYLLTFCGFQIVYGKLSDVVGRKSAILFAIFLFTLFSGMCAASQTLPQLIMFRWVQGIGGCGIVSIVHFVFFELLPPEKWAANMSMVTLVMTLALAIGPLVGGAVASTHQWRWIFLFNVPIGAVSFLILLMAFPTRLSNEPCARHAKVTYKSMLSLELLRRIDVVGCTLLLGFCILVVTGLQQAALGYAWTSGLVLALLLCALAFIVTFLAWEWFVTTKRTYPEPVFPWRFCQSRIRIGMIVNAFLAGYVQIVCLVQIPQRFATVHGLSPLSAGIRLIPLEVFAPAGACLAALVMDRPRIPPVYVLLSGAVLQMIGVTLLSRLLTVDHVEASQYGFQILIGTGVGFVNSALILFVPYAVEKRDLAAGSSAVSQFRYLGGLVGIAVATSITTPYLRTHLSQFLEPDLVSQLLERTDVIKILQGEILNKARLVFAEGYNLQMKMLIGITAAQIPVTLLMWTNQTLGPKKN